MTTYETVEYKVDEGIAEVYIDRPDVLNAFNDTVVEELTAALKEANDSESVYVTILSGRGRAFCAGVDTDETLGPAGERDRMYNQVRLTKVHQVTDQLYGGPKPTIAAINGPALGGGVSFALSCDFRVMSEDAFLRDQHVNLGLPPGAMEAWILPKLIGESKAKEFIYTSQDITPDAAKECGLIVGVSEDGETVADARELARELRDKPAHGVRSAKEMFNSKFHSLEEASKASKELHWQALQDPEHEEALDAVREGRRPDFDREY